MWSVSDEERDALEASWLAFMIPLGGGMPRVSAWWREIEARYSEPHRHYHTLAHINETLRLVNGDAAIAATWFHDLVCDPSRTDNEDASARIAATALRELRFSAPAIDVVTRMIRATAGHERNSLPQQALMFVDADLAILGSNHERYVAYRGAVRREYSALSEEQFLTGRRQFATRFLARPRIYFTETMRERYERQARTNLEWELDN